MRVVTGTITDTFGSLLLQYEQPPEVLTFSQIIEVASERDNLTLPILLPEQLGGSTRLVIVGQVFMADR